MRRNPTTFLRVVARLATVVFTIGLFAFLLHPSTAFAQDALEQFGSTARLGQESLPIIIARIIRVVLGTLGIITVVLLLYSGFLWMTSAGDPKKIERAKAIIKNAVIGLLIIFSSFAITQFVLNALLRAAGIGGITGRDASSFIEPNSGSLGAGVVQDHYPPRNAVDIPRNAKIFVTFKEPVDPSTIIAGFVEGAAPQSIALDPTSVTITPTEPPNSPALTGAEVAVSVSEDRKTFVFDPVPLLGSATKDTNYAVSLTGNIKLANGRDAFTGVFQSGYSWTFQVSTVVDLTPPQVVSTTPSSGAEHFPNSLVQITFNEPMDPVASTGTQNPPATNFTNISVFNGPADTGTRVRGTFSIGNGYRTLVFVPDVLCAKDQCGSDVFCLPTSSPINVVARAATLSTDPPQAVLIGVSYDGVVDAAGNSLDGNEDGTAEGPGADSYEDLQFTTGDRVDDRQPTIIEVNPNLNEGEIATDRPILATFSMPLMATSVTGSTAQMWPDPDHEMFFVPRVDAATGTPPAGCGTDGCSRVQILHGAFLPSDATGGPYSYYPMLTKDIKGSNQFCMYPASGPAETGSCVATLARPFCCNGVAQVDACTTIGTDRPLPPTP